MRALDGYSERQFSEIGDKQAGQSLSREADKLTRQQIANLDAGNPASVKDFSPRRFDQNRDAREARSIEMQKASDLRERAHQRLAETRFDARTGERIDVRTGERFDARTGERVEGRPRKNSQERPGEKATGRAGEKSREHAGERSRESGGEKPGDRASDVRRTEQQRAEQRLENQRRIVEQQRAELRTSESQRREFRASESRRPESSSDNDSTDNKKFKPSMLDGRNWQKDGSGNFVARKADGRLITADAEGNLVDYKSHMSQKHMASQDQMAFMSILFCNPLMMMGMGTALSLMDQAHNAKTAKATEALNKKFDGRMHNKQANQTGYASEAQRKAALMAQYTRMGERNGMSAMGGMGALTGLSAAIEREDLKKRQERKRLDDRANSAKRFETKVSMPQDRYSMSTKKLMKTKKLLEDEIEKVRGKASLEEVSRLYAQVEVLEKALKRLSNF